MTFSTKWKATQNEWVNSAISLLSLGWNVKCVVYMTKFISRPEISYRVYSYLNDRTLSRNLLFLFLLEFKWTAVGGIWFFFCIIIIAICQTKNERRNKQFLDSFSSISDVENMTFWKSLFKNQRQNEKSNDLEQFTVIETKN